MWTFLSTILQDMDAYGEEIAPCRTFVFLRELEMLFEHNLIKGGDLDNAIVIADNEVPQEKLDRLAEKLGRPTVAFDGKGILNNLKLHYQNEPARHKLLDVIGDTYLLGRPIKGRILATKPGHTANVAGLRSKPVQTQLAPVVGSLGLLLRRSSPSCLSRQMINTPPAITRLAPISVALVGTSLKAT